MERSCSSTPAADKLSATAKLGSPLTSNLSSASKKINHSLRNTALADNTTQKINRTDIPSNETLNKMLNIPQSHSSALRTKKIANKRHSIMISSYDKSSYDSRKNTNTENENDVYQLDDDNDNDNDDSFNEADESDPFINVNTSIASKHRSKSLTSLNNMILGDEFNNTIDSEIILQDLNDDDHNTNINARKSDVNYSYTVNNAFADYNKNLNTIINSNIEAEDTDESSDDDDFFNSAPNKKLHPLRKLVINSPNASTNSPKTRVISNSSTKDVVKQLSFDTKLMENENHTTKSNNLVINPLLNSTSTNPYENEKPQCQVISNCIFFGPVRKSENQLPTKPSQMDANNVFNDESPVKKNKSIKSFNFLTKFNSTLVDPELFTKSAGSVFSHPISSLPSQRRTSLYFV